MRSFKPFQFFLQNLSFSFLTILIYLFLSFLPPLLQLINRRENLLLMSHINTLLIFLHLLENFIRIIRYFLLQLFKLLLHLTVLTHCYLVNHVEIALILRIITHKRTQTTPRLFRQICIGRSYSLLLSLHLSSDLLDQLLSAFCFVLQLHTLLQLHLTHC